MSTSHESTNNFFKPLIICIGLAALFFPLWGIWKTFAHSSIKNQPVATEIKPEKEKNFPSQEALATQTDTAEKGATATTPLVTPIPTTLDTPSPKPTPTPDDTYPLHKNITATLFWVGEDANDDNKHISNTPSAWDDSWMKHFGGIDNPKKRNGVMPANFTPHENPFYVALPYNDFDENGNRRSNVSSIIPWAQEKKWSESESMLKNRWVKIIKNDKIAYAQWQDVGPFKEDDAAYVFGNATPKSKTNDHAGIDLSPAANQYLGLGDIDTVDWQFIDDADVPSGPWKTIVTTSQIAWK